jgi:hypothetical protein
LRQDFLSALSQIGFLDSSASSLDKFSTNKGIDSLVKSVVVGGLYPRIARIATPEAMFKQIHAGTVQKDVSGFGEIITTVYCALGHTPNVLCPVSCVLRSAHSGRVC